MYRTVLLPPCLLLILAAGCAKQTTVSGLVTYEGRPVAKGAITFLPVDGQGPSCGAPIIAGHYELALPPGRKVVRIVETPTLDHIPTRAELEQAAKRKSREGADESDRSLPPNASGNNVEVEIVSGRQTLDFALTRPPKPMPAK
jgi:hypothetical protein